MTSTASPHPPVVFISYSHDSPAHREQVLALSERLRADGFETRLDQYVPGSPAEGWPRWIMNQLDAAQFVLVICRRLTTAASGGTRSRVKAKA